MRWTLTLLRGLYVLATSEGRKLTSSRLTMPLESQAHLVPGTGHLQQIQLQQIPRHLPTFFAVRQLQAVNSTSSMSEGSSYYSTSCTETVDGVSITSRVVINGTRFGACYSNTSFEVSGYPAYFTNREKNGLAVRGEEALVIGSNDTSLFWALARYVPDGPEIDSIICYNLVDASSAETPTSNLLDGEWMCEYGVTLDHVLSVSVVASTGDVDGDGTYSKIDDIQIDCGCSAGMDAEEYYACREYVSMAHIGNARNMLCNRWRQAGVPLLEDLALNSSGGFIIDGVSLDGCYAINTMNDTLEHQPYLTGPVEDGVPMMFVGNYYNTISGESAMFWSVGVYRESGVVATCFLEAEILNTTADVATPLSDGNWLCDLDGDGSYERYNGTVEVQCACIDDSYTTCFETAEGLFLDSSIVHDGDSIGGCYLPTGFLNSNAQVFSLFGDPTTVGSIQINLLPYESTKFNSTVDVWTVSQVREYDADSQITTFDTICLALVVDIELPTDPFLQGEWLCVDAPREYLKPEESDFEEVTCGCRDEASSNSASVGVPSSTPAPMLDGTSPFSNPLYPTSRPEATAAPEHPLLSPTSLPADGNAVSTNDASEEQARQYTPVGIIIGSSIGGFILTAGVVAIILCVRIRSKWSVRDSCSSPAGGTSGGGQPGQTSQRNATSTPQGQSIPAVNHGRPVASNCNSRSPPPSYLDMVNP